MLWIALAALIFEILGFLFVRHLDIVRGLTDVQTEIEHIERDCCPEYYME